MNQLVNNSIAILTSIGILFLSSKTEAINYSDFFNPCNLDVVVCENEVPATIIDAKIYAYNSEVSQTDSSPFITASGQRVRSGIIANNCLPFGSKVRINGQTYEVQDRMNSRYGCEVFDIWMPTRDSAIQWGLKYFEVEIIGSRQF